MVAMAGKWDRLVYLDFLCGPGRDIDTDTDEEFPGSPLIALSIEPHFGSFVLIRQGFEKCQSFGSEDFSSG
jgi:hypothetical protein